MRLRPRSRKRTPQGGREGRRDASLRNLSRQVLRRAGTRSRRREPGTMRWECPSMRASVKSFYPSLMGDSTSRHFKTRYQPTCASAADAAEWRQRTVCGAGAPQTTRQRPADQATAPRRPQDRRGPSRCSKVATAHSLRGWGPADHETETETETETAPRRPRDRRGNFSAGS